MIREVDSPVGKVPVIGSPLNLSGSPARYDPIPDLGDATDSILQELGYDAEAIAQMHRDQAV